MVDFAVCHTFENAAFGIFGEVDSLVASVAKRVDGVGEQRRDVGETSFELAGGDLADEAEIGISTGLNEIRDPAER